LRDIDLVARRCLGALALSACVLPPAAAAQTTGGGGAGGGGVYVAQPKIEDVACVSKCASHKRARGGSKLKVTGTGLASADELVFHGSFGKGDDLAAAARAGSDRRMIARVPMGAVTGPLSVETSAGGESKPTQPVAILPPPPPVPNPVLSPVPGPHDAGAPTIETGTSRTRAFVGARPAVSFSYRVSGAAPSALTVQLVRASDSAAVMSWTPAPLAAGEVQTVSWDGRINKVAAKPGRYAFRLTAAAATGAAARSAQTGDLERDAFDLYDHIFPIRGKHDFGGAEADFGSGRAGHSHQGHDVFAKCGKPMVAARGGRVKFEQYHAAAGNYLVIDGAGTSVDYVYMHMAEPSPFQKGDRVYTGQRIGAVGETGNARGCHLHFELWDSPGWYDGGRPFDPLPSLKAWDSWS
jgi:murein DD-endopeptidase MepM/ murein hydrolase activator NlpD